MLAASSAANHIPASPSLLYIQIRKDRPESSRSVYGLERRASSPIYRGCGVARTPLDDARISSASLSIDVPASPPPRLTALGARAVTADKGHANRSCKILKTCIPLFHLASVLPVLFSDHQTGEDRYKGIVQSGGGILETGDRETLRIHQKKKKKMPRLAPRHPIIGFPFVRDAMTRQRK